MTYWIQDATHAQFIMMTSHLWVWSIRLAFHKTLPTFMKFPHFHAFKNGSLGMIWDSNSSNMEEPIANE
jgi:hypothetical protein